MPKQKKLMWKGENITDYRQIVRIALSLKGEERKEFVKRYANTGKYALSNIGYVAGYYDGKTAQRILKIFKTAHPILGNLGGKI